MFDLSYLDEPERSSSHFDHDARVHRGSETGVPEKDAVHDVIASLSRGEIVIVVDDADRENEGDLVMAAVHATPEKMAFILRHCCGLFARPCRGRSRNGSISHRWF